MLNILNLGAGIQSSTVLLMSHRGELPRLDYAIFADTGWEAQAVYDHLAWLENEVDIPIAKVSKCNMREAELNPIVRNLPYYVKNPDGTRGKIKRQCTSEYKIYPIEKFIKREILGLKFRQHTPKELVIDQWFGISADEVRRIRATPDIWRNFCYPLLNLPHEYLKAPMARIDCMQWLKKNYPHITVPRSACIGCPFHSNIEWRSIKENPKEWAEVVAFDKAIRHQRTMRGEMYLHPSLKPLDEIDFSNSKDLGQGDMFREECYGMCGV